MQLYVFNEKKARACGLYGVYNGWAISNKIDLRSPYERGDKMGSGLLYLKFPHRQNPLLVDAHIFDPFIINEPLSNYL